MEEHEKKKQYCEEKRLEIDMIKGTIKGYCKAKDFQK